jgi:hypothetical protein
MTTIGDQRARTTAAAVGEACANCGAHVADRFCGSCGQSRGTLDVSVFELLKQLLAEISSADGRVIRSLKILVARPGDLTAEYLAGRRHRFTPPLRLYLATSFAFFAAFLLTRPIDRTYYGLGGEVAASGYEGAMARLLVLMLPLIAVALKLLLLPLRRPFVHHLVFALHFGAAALTSTLLLTLTAAAFKWVWGHHSASPDWLPDFAFLLYLPGVLLMVGYLVVALRRTYRVDWLYSVGAAVGLVLVVGIIFQSTAPHLLALLGAS